MERHKPKLCSVCLSVCLCVCLFLSMCLSVCLLGIAWKGINPGYVLTSGKDGCLCLHEFSSADEPLSKVSPVAVGIGPGGHVAHAFNNKLTSCSGQFIASCSLLSFSHRLSPIMLNCKTPPIAQCCVQLWLDLPQKTGLQNDLLCVEWDVKLYSLTCGWMYNSRVV